MKAVKINNLRRQNILKRTFYKWFKNEGYFLLFLIPSLFFIILFAIYPIIYNIDISFQNLNVFTLNLGEKIYIGFQNYINIFHNPDFIPVLVNTIIFTFCSVFFQFIIGFMLALLFVNKTTPKLNNICRSFIFVGWVLPDIVVATIWKWLLSQQGGVINYILLQIHLINSPISWLSDPQYALIEVILANVWYGIPFNMMLLSGGLVGLPGEIYEAARIDGANKIQQFFHLTVPLMKPTIFATLILGLIFTLKVFGLIVTMTGGGPVNSSNILSLWSYQTSFDYFEFGQGAAISNILLVIMLISSIFYIRITSKEESYA